MTPARSHLRPLEIGLVSETFDTYPSPEGGPADAHAEYEPLATVELLEQAVGHLGHRSRRLGAPRDVLSALSAGTLGGVDVVWNIAEGYGSRNREAWAPALLEMAGIPCLGSDGLSLSLSLDKAWANRWAAAGGVPVAPQVVMASRREAEESPLPGPFPLFVKPCWEGTSKGIRRTSRVEDRSALAEEVARVVADYGQPALVERFLPGAEYTVSVVGYAPPRALPVLQRALETASGIGLHALEGAGNPQPEGGYGHRLPGELDAELEARLQFLALQAFSLFGCLDFARVDFRLDETGAPVFLEINPLPTFAADGSFGILAELEGRPVADLLADVLAEALGRLGLAGPVRSSSGA
ncbi:MAG: D-alanine--D-alanine ligase [Myxococcota bacterium]|nr:D-alanine--D-alanine ligase [Myxococcota bacterium]